MYRGNQFLFQKPSHSTTAGTGLAALSPELQGLPKPSLRASCGNSVEMRDIWKSASLCNFRLSSYHDADSLPGICLPTQSRGWAFVALRKGLFACIF